MRLLLIGYTFILLLIGLPIAAQDFTWNVNEGCVPLEVGFSIDTASIDIATVSSAVWDFGNELTITANNPGDTVYTTYTEKSFYNVKLVINGDAANPISKFYNGLQDALISDFTIFEEREEPDFTYTFSPTLNVSGNTDANYVFAWEYTQNGTELRNKTYLIDYTEPNGAIDQYTFADTGYYTIQLRVRETNPTYTCESTTSQELAITTEFIVGNVFSPETTDYFIVDPENDAVVLSFKLFSRTGIKVFEQEAPIIYWDGRNSSGQDLGTAVYFYVIEATQGDLTNFYTKQGFIHVFR